MSKKKFHIFPVLGAYITFHTGGELDYAYSGLASSRKLNLDKDPEFSRWDAGLSTGARFQWKKISLGILFDIGLVKINPSATGKWSSAHFTLGYFLK